MELARFESLRRVCRLTCGLPAVHDPTPVPQPTGTTGPPSQLALTGSQGTAPPPVTKVVKMSEVIDQTNDTPIVALSSARVRKLYSDYEDRMGLEPNPDAEPSSDQLAALWMLLGAGTIPYADFSIWGPHQVRMLKKLTFMAMVLGPDGRMKKTELRGPPDYDAWWQSWRVYRTAMILFESVSPEVLDNYAELIRKYSKAYTEQTWFILYQADVRMRQEQFERIIRRLERGLANGVPCPFNYDVNKPWEACFKAAVADKAFWDAELVHPTNLYLLKLKTVADIMDDGTVHPEIAAPGVPQDRGQRRGRSRSRNRSRTPKREPKKRKTDDKKGGRDYTQTQSGVSICPDYNAGKCKEIKATKTKGKGKKSERANCPHGKAHVCSKCLGRHSARNCSVKDY